MAQADRETRRVGRRKTERDGTGELGARFASPGPTVSANGPDKGLMPRETKPSRGLRRLSSVGSGRLAAESYPQGLVHVNPCSPKSATSAARGGGGCKSGRVQEWKGARRGRVQDVEEWKIPRRVCLRSAGHTLRSIAPCRCTTLNPGSKSQRVEEESKARSRSLLFYSFTLQLLHPLRPPNDSDSRNRSLGSRRG